MLDPAPVFGVPCHLLRHQIGMQREGRRKGLQQFRKEIVVGLRLLRLFAFLGLDARMAKATEKMIRPNDNAAVQVEAQAALVRLTRLYACDIHRTARLTGLALEKWPLPGRVAEEPIIGGEMISA
jgi:hypothetical protein